MYSQYRKLFDEQMFIERQIRAARIQQIRKTIQSPKLSLSEDEAAELKFHTESMESYVYNLCPDLDLVDQNLTRIEGMLEKAMQPIDDDVKKV